MHALLHLVVFPPRWVRAIAALAFVLVAANLFWHGAQPYAVGLIPPPWDKLAHAIVYAGFAAAAWVMLGAARPTADVLAPAAALSVGVVDELLQGLHPGRVAGLADLAADAAGAILAVAVLCTLRERMRAVPARADRARGGRPPVS
jgi:VanZ family protein